MMHWRGTDSPVLSCHRQGLILSIPQSGVLSPQRLLFLQGDQRRQYADDCVAAYQGYLIAQTCPQCECQRGTDDLHF